MKGILKIILVISNLFFLSRSLTCSGGTPLYQNLNSIESCVQQCDSSLIEFTADNTCNKTAQCTLYLSSDKKKCTSSCDNDYIDLTQNSININYKICVTACSLGLYQYSESSIKFCNSECPLNSLTKKSTYSCLFDVKDCDLFISFRLNTCDVACDLKTTGYPVVKDGQKFCQFLNNYFMTDPLTGLGVRVNTCPSDYIASLIDLTCYPKRTVCKDKKISADQKTCDYECPNNEILFYLSITAYYCITYCKIPGCKICPDDMILYGNSGFECNYNIHCPYNEYDNGRLCIIDCSVFDQISTKQNECTQCPVGNIFYMTEQGQGACKSPGDLTDGDKDTSIQMTRFLEKQYFYNMEEINYFMNKISDLSQNLYKKLTISSNIKNTFKIIEDLIFPINFRRRFGNTIYFIKLGRINTIMTYCQTIPNYQQRKTTLNMQSLLDGSETGFSEEKNQIQVERNNFVIVQVITSNPACKIIGCDLFPIIQTKVKIDLDISQKPTPFTVDFKVPQASSQYICLNYNLETSEVVGPYAIPVSSNNGLTMTCIVDGAAQLYLDSSCIFLKTGNCLTPPAPIPTPTPSPTSTPSSTLAEKVDGNSGISTGEIAGIVIGAVAGSILFSLSGFLLYKKFVKIRVFNQNDAKLSQPVPNTEPITLA